MSITGMPSPTRTVRKSVAVCLRMGMSRDDALSVVIVCCNAVIARSQGIRGANSAWASAVREEATRCLNGPPAGDINAWR